MKLFLFLAFALLCRANGSYLESIMKLLEDEVEDAPLFASNQDETELAYRRHRRRRLYKPSGPAEVVGGKCMVNKCYNCEITGGETRKADGSIEDCKRRCLRDPNCKGIDVGNSNNKCYFVHSPSARTEHSDYYQAWVKSTNCGGSAIAPDPLDSITYKDMGAGECTHNGAVITQLARPWDGKLQNNRRSIELICELACSFQEKCTGYMMGEVSGQGVWFGKHHSTWQKTCFVYGDWEPIGDAESVFWYNFSYKKGVSGAVNGVKARDYLRNAKCYKKIVTGTPQKPSTVESCPPGKELVKYSNGGSACENPPNWDTAPCHKLKPSLNGRDKWGYGCRAAVYGDVGETASSYCKTKAWYKRCCSYDADYDVCYPKVFDCHVWPKRIYSNKLANYGWFHGPCQYAINSSGDYSRQRCNGGDSSHDPSEEGRYMWFSECCNNYSFNADRDNAYPYRQCQAKGVNGLSYNEKVYPRKKGETYYWN